MEVEKIYADIKLDNDDWFVVTPEGNEFTFPAGEYDENHDPEDVVDPTSNKKYTVIFNA